MRMKAIGSIVGSLGLLLGAGAAWGAEAETAAAAKDCRDAGVTVAFKTGSAELDLNARGALDGVATWMKANDQRTLHLEGFADTTGDTSANVVLSAHRAEAVKNYLVEKGVDAARVRTVGRGEEIDHLPANGRAVTFLACQPVAGAAAVAEAEAEAEAPPAPTPPPEETTPPAPVVVAPVTVIPPPAPPPPSWQRGFGFALMAGGGYQDFTETSMRSTTTGAGAWDARFIAGTNSILGFEAAYVGAARQMSGLGITNNDPYMVSNGVNGNVRLNVPIRYGASLFEPYGYAGLGYSRYTISNYNDNVGALSSFSSSDDVMNFPVGGGFAYAYKAFIMDVRGGWTGTYYQNLLVGGDRSNTLNHWNVGSQIGFRF
jgi:peptidoglycan-associated lipoprotein